MHVTLLACCGTCRLPGCRGSARSVLRHRDLRLTLDQAYDSIAAYPERLDNGAPDACKSHTGVDYCYLAGVLLDSGRGDGRDAVRGK